MPDGRILKGEATKQRVVAAAQTLFATHGYDGTSIEEILVAAEVSRGALYHHFPTKQAVFDAVLDQVLDRTAAAAARAAEVAPDAADALRTGLVTWLEIAKDPAVQRIALVDAPAVVGWSRLREIDARHGLAGMSALMYQLADDNRLPDGDVDVLTHMLLAAAGEAAIMAATAPDPNTAFDAARKTIEALLDRLIASESPHSPTPTTASGSRTG